MHLPIEPSQIAVEVVCRKTQEVELELLGVEFLDQYRQCCLIPPGVERQLIVGNDECLALCVRQMPEPDHRHLGEPQLLRRSKPAMAGDDRA